MKRKSSLLFLVAILLLVTGCGNSTASITYEQETDSTGAGLEQVEALYAKYQSISLEGMAGESGTLLNLSCLATSTGVYISGVRAGDSGSETVIYRTGRNQETELVAAYSGESLLTWCQLQEETEGVAFLGIKMESRKRQYTLHVLQNVEGAWSEETFLLTDAIEKVAEQGRFSAMAVSDESVVLAGTGEVTAFVIALPDGGLMHTIPLEISVACMTFNGEGKVQCVLGNNSLLEIDTKAGSKNVIGENLYGQFGGSRNYCCILDKQVLVGTVDSIYAVSYDGQQARKLLSYEDFDVIMQQENSLSYAENTGQGEIVTWDAGNGQIDIYYLSGQPFADTGKTEKKIVTFAQYYVSPEIQEMVAAFNRSSDEYYIELISGEGDYEGYHTRLRTQLSTGEGPDILEVASNAKFAEYIEKGIVEDLKPYIRRDLQEEDYVESALYAYAWNDGIYALESSFQLAMLVSSKKVVGDKKSLTVAEMAAIMAAHPEIKSFNDYCGQESVLRECMWALEPTDYEGIKQSILFAEQYGNGTVYGLPGGEDAIVGENVLFESLNLTNPLTLADYQEMYGDDLALMAYVGTEGMTHASSGYSINAGAKEKEGAWAFFKFMLSEEYQSTFSEAGNLPILKSVYEERITRYLTPQSQEVYLTETGENVTITSPYYLVQSGKEIDVMTEEQVEMLLEMVAESKVRTFVCDYDAINIVYEEAGAYFSGDKPIDEVMEAIRGRMEVYLNEK